ncbi:3-oxoacyl-[acyl-carrier-protein] reductase FabG [Massilia sp. Bi118]|uniref:SDR family NAD(P)-dependent oxidoreductase n=1 Tax=Massilia sp. Bi118 TaxID=2822346 RepID=UPI001D46F2C0|nr:SDR family oxidoreductase [Massilia sp. Bi118]CAH0136444.1 3-oxoacyl-[acyl-carrier-protein] reductase FabG [Massilia sp. Bi118]
MFQHPFQLRGKTILVTGASSGIGRAIAVECARVGARVVISGRSPERLQQTMALMDAASSGGHVACEGDLTDMAQLDMLVAAAGEVDGVVHAAGISSLSPMRMLRESFMQNTLNNNFMAPLMLTQKFLFKKSLRNNASIVFLSSIAAHTGTVGLSPYAASKAALEGMMRCLALEIAPRGMRANALVPGTVDTPMVRAAPDLLEAQARMYPLGVGKPEDVAYAAIYLLCDASRKVTGTQLHLDGGIPWT